MERRSVVESLKLHIEATGLQQITIERQLGMPVNSLSHILSFKKELPAKWCQPILGFLSQSPVPTAKQIAEKFGLRIASDLPIKELWVVEIERYCDRNDCSYADLIVAHENWQRLTKSKTQAVVPIIAADVPQTTEPEEAPILQPKRQSAWLSSYRKQKCGF